MWLARTWWQCNVVWMINILHRLMYWNNLTPADGAVCGDHRTSRRCGLPGGSTSLGQALRVYGFAPLPVLALSAICSLTCCHAFPGIMDPNLELYSKINFTVSWVTFCHDTSSQQQRSNKWTLVKCKKGGCSLHSKQETGRKEYNRIPETYFLQVARTFISFPAPPKTAPKVGVQRLGPWTCREHFTLKL